MNIILAISYVYDKVIYIINYINYIIYIFLKKKLSEESLK